MADLHDVARGAVDLRGRAAIAVALVAVVIGAVVVSASGGSSVAGAAELAAGLRVEPAQPSDCFAELPPHDPGATVLGRVHFFGFEKGWEQGDELPVGANRHGKRDTKQAIAIRGHGLVTLRVPASSRRTVDLAGWGTNNARDKADTIRIRLDADSLCAEDEWAAYPGGFTFTRRQCLLLEVAADGRSARVPFGLGESCN